MGKRNVYDVRLTEMLEKVTGDIRDYSIGFIDHIKKLSEIGISLTSEKNNTKILEMIVEEAKNFTNADAGTLYSVDGDHLRFEILYNDTFGNKLGGTTGKPITLPPVPIHEENVSGYVAKTGEIINIPDAYQNSNFDFTGPKKYDAQTGYLSKSFLVVPMRNHENTIIGVLQLINAKDAETSEVIPFAPEYEDIIFSLASQAAVAITNAQLIKDIEAMLNSFVKVMATAIDERTPYNKRHTERVAKYTVALAAKINDIDYGKYKEAYFTEEKLAELNMASWLHDVGKVTTPDTVMDKAVKLESRFDRSELIRERLLRFITDCRLKEKNGVITKPEAESLSKRLRSHMEFLAAANNPSEFLDDDSLKRLNEIRAERYTDHFGETMPLITDWEYENLSVRKGSLTDSERGIMQNHVTVTAKLLSNMPFIKKYRDVPSIAASHHEKVNCSGYPEGLCGDDIPLGGKIMAIADFFDALTASDRPYKKAMSVEQAFSIMERSAADEEIDGELLAIFREYRLFDTIKD